MVIALNSVRYRKLQSGINRETALFVFVWDGFSETRSIEIGGFTYFLGELEFRGGFIEIGDVGEAKIPVSMNSTMVFQVFIPKNT